MDSFIWVLFGLLVGVAAATRKEFNVAGGAFAGALLGPFSLLMFLVPVRKAPTKVCPSCAEKVQAAAKVCRHCRHAFTTNPYAQP